MEVWDLFVAGGQKEPDSFLVIESLGELCTVGADVSNGCPLVVSNKVTPENIVQSLQRVLNFRRGTPDGAADRKQPDSGGGVIITVLENHGMAWRSKRHGDETG
ncbi:hypothetical protein ACIOUE_39210 [Streptomyces xanthochromogenes]|uniref:hypothetical protein n=1 Tax=Streptomyces xanthochromogenes TaxID=67384 RepID=UPI003820322E